MKDGGRKDRVCSADADGSSDNKVDMYNDAAS